MSERNVQRQTRADVEFRMPADSAFVAVLRTTAASVAARLDFTIDDIEDLRMAVGEACALVLTMADEGADLTSRFFFEAGVLTLRIQAPAADAKEPDTDSFAWQVLTTLADQASASVTGGEIEIALTMHSAMHDTPS
ncbi:ATP-binding protein [Nocardioides sp.]|uniref:ATP-binding protein n=1 Tax=Nocardioides sp. TaxID=35761 RepID=UPI0035620CA7